MTSISQPPVIVIAASAEGLDALIRLLHQLPPRLPALFVGMVHGVDDDRLETIIQTRLRTVRAPSIAVLAMGDVVLMPGQVYLMPASSTLAFTAHGVLGAGASAQSADPDTAANRLFESAARIHGKLVVGVVLSGRGHDGTRGMLAITDAGGTRVVQTPCEANHPGMPFHALMHDHINHSVVLDDMGPLICKLIRLRVASA